MTETRPTASAPAGARVRRRGTAPPAGAPSAGRVRGAGPESPPGQRQRPPRGRNDLAAERVAAPPARTLLRWATICLLILAVSVGLGYGLSVAQDPVYGAETDVLYRVADGSGARAERDLATQQVILQGRAVLQPVAQEAGMPVESLQDLLSVEILGQSDVLRITVEHPDPDRAVDLARATSEHYVLTVTDGPVAGTETAAFVEDQVAELTAALEAVEDELAELAATREAAGEPQAVTPAEQRLHGEADDLRDRIDGLQFLLVGGIAPDGAEVRVLTPAYLLEQPLRPQPVRAAVAGGMAALVVVAGLVTLLARRWGYV